MYNLQQMARSRNWRVHNESQFQRLDLSQAPEIKEKYINYQALLVKIKFLILMK